MLYLLFIEVNKILKMFNVSVIIIGIIGMLTNKEVKMNLYP